MLDLEAFVQSFVDHLKTYCGIPRLIRSGVDIPLEQLQTPRIVWDITKSYIPGNWMPITTWKTVPGTIDPANFPQDIQKTVITNPQAIFSFTLYGEPGDSNNNQYIQKAREWFAISFLGPKFLDNDDVVIAEVSEIQNRSDGTETNPEERRGFEVTFRFNEKVTTVISAIEHVEGKGTIQT